ncbi:MAG: hypothetical protein JRJ00_03300 [Deltaproteobacteria bacterium]|nr:hypothetical protein [Deltaproteobacteria bacterium]
MRIITGIKITSKPGNITNSNPATRAQPGPYGHQGVGLADLRGGTGDATTYPTTGGIPDVKH